MNRLVVNQPWAKWTLLVFCSRCFHPGSCVSSIIPTASCNTFIRTCRDLRNIECESFCSWRSQERVRESDRFKKGRGSWQWKLQTWLQVIHWRWSKSGVAGKTLSVRSRDPAYPWKRHSAGPDSQSSVVVGVDSPAKTHTHQLLTASVTSSDSQLRHHTYHNNRQQLKYFHYSTERPSHS